VPKSMRQIQQAETERIRTELRQKINARLKQIIKQEEEAARKQVEDCDHPIDEEYLNKLLAGEDLKKKDSEQDKPTALNAPLESKDEESKTEGNKNFDDYEDAHNNEDDSSSSIEEFKNTQKPKKSSLMMGALSQLVEQSKSGTEKKNF